MTEQPVTFGGYTAPRPPQPPAPAPQQPVTFGGYTAPRPPRPPAPEPQLPWQPEMTTLPDGSIGYFDETGNWVQIQGPDPWASLEFPQFPEMPEMPDLGQYAPTTTQFQVTPEQLLSHIENMLRSQIDEAGARIFGEGDIQAELHRVLQDIEAKGYGVHTPYYGSAVQYYGNIAGIEGAFNTSQMSASDYMDFQLAIMQMVNNQNIAQFQAQVEQTMWGAQLQLSQQQLAAQLQTAMLPYQQMTVWQQAQLEQAAEGDPMAQDRLELERELGRLPYEQMTAYQQAQIDMALATTEQELAFARERLELERQTAMMPYEAMTAAERAQLELAQMPYEQMTMWQQEQAGLQQQEMALAQQQLEQQMQLAQLPYEQMTAAQQAQLGLAQMPYEQMTMWQQEQAALQQQQLAQQMQMAQLPYEQMTAYQEALTAQEQQRYGAQLAAQPHSWLEYAAYTGETPAIQPWMQPLMPQQYQQLGAGQAIPGYQGTEGMTGMPQLTTPSRQYQARMGPTAMGQYQGYQQARTGARPEETEWRLWSGAPPSGAGSRLQYTR